MRLKVSNVCQLYDKTYLATQTVNGVTFTNNGDGSVTVNGTASNTATAEGEFLRVNPGDIILMFSGYDIAGLKTAYVYCSQWDENKKWIADLGYPSLLGRISTCVKNCRYIRYTYRVDTGNTATNAVIKLQMFNLTEMYGAGNEPTTVEQFRQDFPNEMYDYSPVCWKKFSRLKYIANKQPVQLYAKNIWKEYTDLYGVSIKNNNDGSITLNGTATQTFFYTNRLDYEIKPNHKYLYFDYYPQTPSWDTYVGGCEGKVNHESEVKFAIYNLNNDGTIDPSSPNLPSNTLLNTFCMCYKGFTFNNITVKPQLFDLTEMYGAGNEPTTVEQFRQDFPNELYDYNPYNYLILNRGKFIANKEPVQLLDKSKYPATGTSNGITYTKNEDGSYDVNGTIVKAALSVYVIGTAELKKNHIYLNNRTPSLVADSQKSYIKCKIYYRSEGKWVFPGPRFKCGLDDAYAQISLLVNQSAGTVISNEKLYPNLFDLTEMYGEGNEPTEEEFWATHSKTAVYDYNPYNAITFR